MQATTRLLIEMWDLVSRDEKKVQKLEELIYNINVSLERIASEWKKIQKLKGNDNKLLLMYEKFLKNALNDYNSGEVINNKLSENEGTHNKDSILGEYHQYMADGTAYILANGMKVSSNSNIFCRTTWARLFLTTLLQQDSSVTRQQSS